MRIDLKGAQDFHVTFVKFVCLKGGVVSQGVHGRILRAGKARFDRVYMRQLSEVS